MDNTATNALHGFDEATETVARDIRQAGWDQVPWVDGQWPPMDQVLTIRLLAVQWEFAVSHLAKSLAWPSDDESEALERAALAEVSPQLG
ncbi:hypothetical protein [Pseudonocardia alaniniphila]|uniref:Uncharacterized protein n=1 Tax=Pseudonocardia alaniniphila TaxID=75291 RepID=A0ABS9TF85_9PSEU|nr:hypothetical protein [Pseudonocardia alaniniphila]MCH6167048.1 hypothetical protein [Pseudonocardia alaniniphila]